MNRPYQNTVHGGMTVLTDRSAVSAARAETTPAVEEGPVACPDAVDATAAPRPVHEGSAGAAACCTAAAFATAATLPALGTVPRVSSISASATVRIAPSQRERNHSSRRIVFALRQKSVGKSARIRSQSWSAWPNAGAFASPVVGARANLSK